MAMGSAAVRVPGAQHGARAALIWTAEGYATDGDGDELADVWNPADAIAAAARLLQTDGAPRDYRRALFAYNPDRGYVDAVLAQAIRYRGAFAPGASAGARAVLA